MNKRVLCYSVALLLACAPFPAPHVSAAYTAEDTMPSIDERLSFRVEKHPIRYVYNGQTIMNAFDYEIRLSGASATSHAALDKRLRKISEARLRSTKEAFDFDKDYFIERITDLRQYLPDHAGFVEEHEMEVLRCDNQITSLAWAEYKEFGGAHPVQYYHAMTIDSRTGRDLPLSAVLVHTYNLADIIFKETVQQADPDQAKSLAAESDQSVKDSIRDLIKENHLCWGLGEDGLHLYFGNYILGPYAIGTFESVLTFEKYGYLFVPGAIFRGNPDAPLKDSYHATEKKPEIINI